MKTKTPSSQTGFCFDNSYLSLPTDFFSRIKLNQFPQAQEVVFNDDLCKALHLNLHSFKSNERAKFLSGSRLIKGSQPFAQSYSGHQFGHFTKLGDGRACVLGEHLLQSNNGEVLRFDIQLKGSGRTPYSRNGDGFATLSSVLREYLMSEAMYALRIPTTRSLAVVKTGGQVYREQVHQGAVLTRVALSHIRIGTFEHASYLLGAEKTAHLIAYTFNRLKLKTQSGDSMALCLLKQVVVSQANLVTEWMRVGFIHGVMNTDNVSIAGETLDYGPCAMMDEYHPQTVFSAIDRQGRYAYAQQPLIAQWNIACLAQALLPHLHKNTKKAVELAKEQIESFMVLYKIRYFKMMAQKLGLEQAQKSDKTLIEGLLALMSEVKADYTLSFCDLMSGQSPHTFKTPLKTQVRFEDWFNLWQQRLKQNNPNFDYQKQMQKHNPQVIARNHLVEQALNSASSAGSVDGKNGENLKPFFDLLEVLKNPYDLSHQGSHYQKPPKPSERIYHTFCGT